MVRETVYSSAPALGSPRRFAAEALGDLRIVPRPAWRMFRREMRARFRQSLLGSAWLVVPTLATTLVWVYLDHAGVLHFGETGTPYIVYVLAGLLLWQAFLEALNMPLKRLTAAREVLKKARLPHETFLVAGALEVVLGFAVRLVPLAVVMAFAGAPVRVTILLVPLGFAVLVVLGFLIGLLVAPLGLLYEDIGQGILVVGTLWFFLTPVVYPLPASGTTAALVRLNPVTPVLVTTRSWLTGAPGAEPVATALVAVGSLVLLVLAWATYRLARPHLVARL